MSGRIAVIGTGYVGLVTGTCFADLGNNVVCMDIDRSKVERLKEGESPIYEPGLEEMLHRNLKAGRIHFTTSYEEALQGAEFVFIAVGTPESPDGSADMKYVESAAKSIGQLAPGRACEPLRIINKSTVPIGSGDQVSGWVRSVSRTVSTSRSYRTRSSYGRGRLFSISCTLTASYSARRTRQPPRA